MLEREEYLFVDCRSWKEYDRSWQDIADVVTKKSKKHLKLSSDDKTAR